MPKKNGTESGYQKAQFLSLKTFLVKLPSVSRITGGLQASTLLESPFPSSFIVFPQIASRAFLVCLRAQEVRPSGGNSLGWAPSACTLHSCHSRRCSPNTGLFLQDKNQHVLRVSGFSSMKRHFEGLPRDWRWLG